MYRIGQPEIDALTDLIQSGKLFRYQQGSTCEVFEKRWSDRLGVNHTCMTASGTNALVAGMMGLGIGPGDEVLVPACTYMATATAVVAAGAIPVIIDIDESLGIDPEAIDCAVGPNTRAVVPVHMWGLACDMDRIMKVAAKHDLFVIEDACQAVGGSYNGKPLGSFGQIGGFSFNFYKNISTGEGGAVSTNDEKLFQRIMSAVDCCRFYWEGRDDEFAGFCANSARASVFEGAIINAQLDQLDDMLDAMRAQKDRILKATADHVTAAPNNSPGHECATHNMFKFDTPEQAQLFAGEVGGQVTIATGRHVYTQWDPILNHHGGHHPAMNPFTMPANEPCRKNYTPDMCQKSLDILARTVMVSNHPDHTDVQVDEKIQKIITAAGKVKSLVTTSA